VAFIHIIEDDGNYEIARLVSTHDKYLLPDGSQMFVPDTFAWCPACSAFVMVETLQPAEELENSARKFYEDNTKNPHLGLKLLPGEMRNSIVQRGRDKSLRQASLWRVALQTRVSPARCLKCGGFRFSIIPADHSWTRNPALNARLVRVRKDIIHASMKESGGLYDMEGRRIVGQYAS
jgi:hypothetical protein